MIQIHFICLHCQDAKPNGSDDTAEEVWLKKMKLSPNRQLTKFGKYMQPATRSLTFDKHSNQGVRTPNCHANWLYESKKSMFSETLGNTSLAKVLMPLMTVPNWNLLNSSYKLTMKNTILLLRFYKLGNLLLRFYKLEIVSKLYSLTIISVWKTWLIDISLKTWWWYLLW